MARCAKLRAIWQGGWSEPWGSLPAVPHRRPTHVTARKNTLQASSSASQRQSDNTLLGTEKQVRNSLRTAAREFLVHQRSPSNGQPNDTVELSTLTALTWLRALRAGFGPNPHVPVSACTGRDDTGQWEAASPEKPRFLCSKRSPCKNPAPARTAVHRLRHPPSRTQENAATGTALPRVSAAAALQCQQHSRNRK